MLHPSSRIVIYLVAALVFPGLSFFVVILVLLLALWLLRLQGRSPFHLIARTRWLLLVLLLGYAYSLPGEALWPALEETSPSQEGLIHGTKAATRLVALLLWLDVLVLSMPVDHLLAGLFRLFQPVTRIGLDARGAALRLGLTLRAIETLERGVGNLGGLLKLDSALPVHAVPEKFTIQLIPLRTADVLVPLILISLAASAWIFYQ